MAYSVEVARHFEERLDETIGYIVNTLGAPRAAKAILDEYERQLEHIAQSPDWFPIDRDLSALAGANVYRATVRSYRAFFVIDEPAKTVHLVSFRHQSEDASAFDSSLLSEN